MKLAHKNIVMLMLMLVAFIGQAMASTAVSYSAASCVHGSMAEMSMMTHESADMVDMADEAMSHAGMMLNADEQKKNQSTIMDCCQELCKCPMNGCVSLSLLVNSSFISEVIAEQKIFHTSSSHQSQVSSSLYRPPIS
mgnify:FL=1